MTEEGQATSEIRDRVKSRIMGLIYTYKRVKDADLTDALANTILSIPEIAIVDREAKLPENPFVILFKQTGSLSTFEKGATNGYDIAQQDMVKANWVKEIK